MWDTYPAQDFILIKNILKKMGAIKNAIFENVTAQIGGHALPKISQQLIFNILFE